MNIEAVAVYMEMSGLGRRGQSVFVTEMPSECREGVLMINRYSGSRIDHELPGWRDTGFRAVVRSPEYSRGYAMAERVGKLLTIHQDVVMGGVILVKQCLPMNDPLPYRRSDGGFWEFEVDVECIYIIL
jgi:hypothetical protein